MTVYITAISPGTAKQHEHIARVRWVDSKDSTSKVMSVAQAVGWLLNGNKLTVASDTGPVEVRAVDATPPYIRTVADEKYTDNLLALPRF